MSLARKYAFASGIIWLLITIVFTVVVARLGIEAFASEAGERSRDVIASIIVPGYLINFFLIWRTFRGRKSGEIDERDKAIEHRATELTAVLLLLGIFLFCIGLYDANVDKGTVPAGWLFVLAYGTIAVVSALHPIMTLVLDFSGRVNG